MPAKQWHISTVAKERYTLPAKQRSISTVIIWSSVASVISGSTEVSRTLVWTRDKLLSFLAAHVALHSSSLSGLASEALRLASLFLTLAQVSHDDIVNM